MDTEYRRLLHLNSTVTLLESYVAIEKFVLDTRLPFVDQYKLFELLHQLLPHDENNLTCKGFLAWLVWRVDQRQQENSSIENQQNSKRAHQDDNDDDDRTSTTADATTKKSKTNGTQQEEEMPSSNGSLLGFAQQELEHQVSATPNLQDSQKKIDRLQSVVFRLASSIDMLNNRSAPGDTPSINFMSNIKCEQFDSNVNGEIEEDEDETSDVNHRLDLPATTSSNQIYPSAPITTRTIMYKGKNMMRHLRPRTTLTGFARHVASDLFSREEIMAKLHVDHNHERDIFLRHCICTAWNMTEQELYASWPKIRNALLQLRRDAIAGKCIRMNSSNKSQTQSNNNNNTHCNSDYEDDES